jgi:hypothetical protein
LGVRKQAKKRRGGFKLHSKTERNKGGYRGFGDASMHCVDTDVNGLSSLGDSWAVTGDMAGEVQYNQGQSIGSGDKL